MAGTFQPAPAASRRGVLATMAAGLLGVVTLTAADIPTAEAWSADPVKRDIENQCARLMKANYPAYTITACDCRANMREVVVMTRNRAGNNVRFTAPVTSVSVRGGGLRYYCGMPVPDQR